MRTIFFGSPPFAIPAFHALLQSNELPIALVTAPPRRSGRGRKEEANPLVVMAEEASVKVFRPESTRSDEWLQTLKGLKSDLGVVVSYGQILNWATLVTPRYGLINLHGSLLPRWRGASPIQAAILAGDKKTGVCIQQMVEALDAGPVLACAEIALTSDERADELFQRLSRLGASLLMDFLKEVKGGPLPSGEAQNARAVTVCKKIKSTDGRIDWNQSADVVDRLVRAMAGWPSARSTLSDGSSLKIHTGEPSSLAANAEPGTVISLEGGVFVQCNGGSFRIDRLQRAGKGALNAMDYVRGSSMKEGEVFG